MGTDIGEIEAGTQEEGLAHVGVRFFVVDGAALTGGLDHLHELVDGTDGPVVPETGGRVLVVGNIAGGVAEHLVLVVVRHAHAGQAGIQVGQQGQHAVLGGLQVFGRHLAQVAFHVVEKLVAGDE